jgi:hypothetical protein
MRARDAAADLNPATGLAWQDYRALAKLRGRAIPDDVARTQRLGFAGGQDAERTHPRSRATPQSSQTASTIKTAPITAHCIFMGLRPLKIPGARFDEVQPPNVFGDTLPFA